MRVLIKWVFRKKRRNRNKSLPCFTNVQACLLRETVFILNVFSFFCFSWIGKEKQNLLFLSQQNFQGFLCVTRPIKVWPNTISIWLIHGKCTNRILNYLIFVKLREEFRNERHCRKATKRFLQHAFDCDVWRVPLEILFKTKTLIIIFNYFV